MTMASTEKVFRVLEKLCQDGPCKASVISAELALNKSSVHRFLNVLVDMGYIFQDAETGLYTATLKVYEMGVQVKNRIGIARIAAPIMRRLQVELNEAINLGVLYDFEMFTLERFTPDDKNTKIVVKARLPAYCTALGKILLAHLDPEHLEGYLTTTEFKAYTVRTVTDPNLIRDMLQQIRQDAVAIDDRELDDNIRSVAAPVRDDSGMVVAGMSVTGSALRLAGEHFETVTQRLITATEEVSSALGYRRK